MKNAILLLLLAGVLGLTNVAAQCPLSLSSSNNVSPGMPSATLTYQGCTGGTVAWDYGLGMGNNKTVSPTATTVYSATCTPTSGTASVTVMYIDCSITTSANPTTIDAGQSSVLSYSGCAGGTVDWSQRGDGFDSGNNITVSPTVTTTYRATCSIGTGFCTSDVTVTVNGSCSVSASANPASIIAGQSSVLSYSGCANGTVNWNNGVGSGNNKTVTPSSTTTYRATCTPNGGGTPCTSNVTVTVVACSLTTSANPASINAGQSSVLSYSDCTNGTVSWDNGLGSGNNKTVTPIATTTYRATCTPNGGGTPCTSDVTVTVIQCSVIASASSMTINAGQSTMLGYENCTNGTVSWNNGAGNGNNLTVSPTTTTTYRATCTPNGGGTPCTSDVTVTVVACSLTTSANPAIINAGQSSVLTFQGCSNGTVSWDNGLGSGNNKTVTPTATTTYRATCNPTGGGTPCTSDVTVSVNAPCSVSASANPATINAGQSTILSYQGCAGGTVSWNNGAGNANNVTVTPATTTTYRATCNPAGGGASCTSDVTVTVIPCTLTTSASPTTINAGQSSVLNYQGCTNGVVSWDNGVGSGNNKDIAPTVTTTYRATCNPNGGGIPCTSDVTVTVIPCIISTSANPSTITAGQSATLTFMGCTNGTVSWDNGLGTGNNKIVTPTVTTTYQATCQLNNSRQSCTSDVTVTVNTPCSVSTSANPVNINAGQSTILSYQGCTNGTVSWNNSAGNGNNLTVSPTTTTTYRAICTPNGGGTPCTSEITVTVVACSLTTSANPTSINAGQSSVLTFQGCSNGTVSWDNGLGSGNNKTVTPSATTTYRATCTPNGGGTPCTSDVTITVSNCGLTTSANPASIIAGQSSVLSYSGCANGTVNWNNGVGSGNNKTVTPTVTTIYQATCTPNGGGTTCTSDVTVTITPCTINASASPATINAGQSSLLSYQGCTGGTVDWTTTQDVGVGSGNNLTVSPTATTTYIANCSYGNTGAFCTSNVTVTVVACSLTTSANPASINAGQSSVLSYSDCTNGTVSWDNGLGSGNNKTVTPIATTTYRATCTPNGGGTPCTSDVTVTVVACSITFTTLSNPVNINAGQSSVLSYQGCSNGTVSWDNGLGTGNNKTVTPTATTTYRATCNPTGGGTPCTSDVTVTVSSCNFTVAANPAIINAGQSSVLSYQGCTNGTVSWDNGVGSGNNKTVSPTATTTYKATCTPNGGGTPCTSEITVTVTACNLTTSASLPSINAGQSTILSYQGCTNGTVSWDNGVGSGNNKIVSPTTTTTYRATCNPTGDGNPCTSDVTVTVSNCGLTTSANPASIIAGQSSVLSYSGCANGTVSWDNGLGSGNNKTVTPSSTTTYRATCTPTTGGNPCTSDVMVMVTPCTLTASASPATINAGQSSLLSYQGCTGGTVDWTTTQDVGVGSGNNLTVSPTATTTYIANCSYGNTGAFCTSNVTVTVNAPCSLTISASPATVNAGQNSILSYAGCTGGTVSWDNGLGSGNNKTVTPTTTTTYRATCTPNGGGTPCTSDVTVTVNGCNLTTSASPATINAGQSSVLSYQGCANGTVSWDNGVGSGNNRTVSPATTTTYRATCTPNGGGTPCTSEVTVTVNSVCSVTVSASPTNINAGQSSVLSYVGCANGIVSWNNGVGSGNNITVNPSATTTYVATCTPNGGTPCTNQVTITVNGCDLTTSASPATLNAGQSSVLTYQGCANGTVSWDNGIGSGNNKTVTPTATTTYRATCTPSSGGNFCTSTVTVTVSGCDLTISANPTSLNAGQSSVLTYNGCSNGTVSWDNGLGTGNNKTVSPTITTTYRATCTPSGGGTPCTNTVTVTVNSCNLTTSASLVSVNAGQNSILTYNGCANGTVSWDNGLGSGNNKVVSPTTTTTYAATCNPTGGGTTCTSTITISVNPCTLSSTASPATLNAGQSSVLTYQGCTNGTVIWNNGLGSGNVRTVNPLTTTTYQATCFPTGGGTPCTSDVTVNVIQCAIGLTASPAKINVGQSTNLSYSGCPNGTVTWNEGLGSGNNKTVTPTATTTYRATCTPAGGGNSCSAEVTLAVEPAPIAIQIISFKKPTCVDTKNGSLTVNLDRRVVRGESTIRLTLSKNGSVIGTYLFDGPSFTTPEFLDAGTYSMLIETLIGTTPSARTTGTVTITSPDPVAFSLAKTDVNCFGGTDGKIDIRASGGTGQFFYQLTTGQTAFANGDKQTLTNLAPGTYTVRVSDSFNCPAAGQSITVGQPANAVTLAKISQKDPRGFETKDGQAVVRVAGGTPMYRFEWVDEQGTPYGNGVTASLTNTNGTLRGGVYTARVFDANYEMATQKAGCSGVASFTLTEPPVIEAKIDLSRKVSCFGKKDGSIAVTPAGGVPATTGYVLKLQNKTNPSVVFPPAQNSFANLPAGPYSLTVTDANDVSRSFDYVITEPQPILMSLLATKDLTCNGDKNGAVEIAATGGTAPYTASWSNNAKGMKISNLAAGVYTGVVADANGCRSGITSAEIKEPTKIDVAFTVSPPTCYSACDGQIAAGIAGGAAPYTFVWEGRAERIPRIEKLCGGESLTFKVVDTKGCEATKTTQISQLRKIDLKLGTDRTVCQGQKTLLDATSEFAQSYRWTLPNSQTVTTPVIETGQAGTYTVSVRDSANCEFKSSVTVKQAPNPGTIRFAATSAGPINEPIVVLNLSDPAPVSIDWITPAGATITQKTNEKLEFSMAKLGDYTLGIKATFVGCEIYQTKTISIIDFFPKTVLLARDKIDFSVSPNPTVGEFNVNLTFDKPTDFTVRLYSLSTPQTVIFEKTAKAQVDFETKIDASGLGAGTYILAVDMGNDQLTKKVIIIK